MILPSKISLIFVILFYKFDNFELTNINESTQTTKTRNFDLKLTKITCRANPNLFENVTCHLKPVRNKAGILNLSVDFKEPIDYGWVRIYSMLIEN